MVDVTLHVDATYRWSEMQELIKHPNLQSVLLINASPQQVSYALLHCRFVIVRIFDPFREYAGGVNPDFEKTILDNHSPPEFPDMLDRMGYGVFRGNENVRFVVGWNELYGKRGNDLRIQNDKMVAVGQTLVSAGYGVGLGGWAADKSFHSDDVAAGHWDSVIDFAIANPQFVHLDIHEYNVLRPAIEHLQSYPQGFPDSLKIPANMQAGNFGSVPYTRDEGNIENNYHIGRTALLWQRSLNRHGQGFRWYAGEAVHDFKADGALKPLIDGWVQPNFGTPRGINSDGMRGYYRHINSGQLSELQYDALLAEDIQWFLENTTAETVILFAWNASRDWVQFDYAKRMGLVQFVIQHEGVFPPVTGNPDTQPLPDDTQPVPTVYDPQPEDFALYEVATTTGGGVRIRETPSLSSVVIGAFDSVPEIVAIVSPTIPREGYPVSAGGYLWVVVILEGGQQGWSAWSTEAGVRLLELSPVQPQTSAEETLQAIRDLVC